MSLIFYITSFLVSFLLIYPRTVFFSFTPIPYYASFVFLITISLFLVSKLQIRFLFCFVFLLASILILNILHAFPSPILTKLFPDILLFPAFLFIFYVLVNTISQKPRFFLVFSNIFLSVSFLLSVFVYLSYFNIISFAIVPTFNDAYATTSNIFLPRHVGVFGEPAGASAIFALAALLCSIWQRWLLFLFFASSVVLSLSLGGLLAILTLLALPIPFILYQFCSRLTFSRRIAVFLVFLLPPLLYLFYISFSDHFILFYTRLSIGALGDVRTLAPLYLLGHSFSSIYAILFGSGIQTLPSVLQGYLHFGINQSSYNIIIDLLYSYGLPLLLFLLFVLFRVLTVSLGSLSLFSVCLFLSSALLISSTGWSFQTLYPYMFLFCLFFKIKRLQTFYQL